MIAPSSARGRGYRDSERLDERGEGTGSGVREASFLVRRGREFISPLAGENLECLFRILRANEGVGEGFHHGREDTVRAEALR